MATYSIIPLLHTNFGAATKALVNASLSVIYAVTCHNTNAAVRYLQLHNKATAPAASDVPLYSWPIPAGTAAAPGTLKIGVEFFMGNGGEFTVGLGWAVSTTVGTFTDGATASEHGVHIHYK